jgi:nucleotide-binding universal stress UspA family protein
MASTEEGAMTTDIPNGPVLFAYDGCELAQYAIAEAGEQLAPGTDAVIVTVWQPADVGFVPVSGARFDAADASDVHRAAEETAAAGAELARQAGFRPETVTVEAAPTWKGLVSVAKERNARLIVLGSHRRTGLRGRLLGSVASAVVQHSDGISVLVVHRSEPDDA